MVTVCPFCSTMIDAVHADGIDPAGLVAACPRCASLVRLPTTVGNWYAAPAAVPASWYRRCLDGIHYVYGNLKLFRGRAKGIKGKPQPPTQP